jgi:enoyl-CoA hydratase/carnithine racemase
LSNNSTDDPDLLLLERQGGVAIATLNDPDRLNAMTEAMGQALASAVETLAQDDSVRVVVLTGAGRAFSAGGDLDLLERMAQSGNASRGGETRRSHQAFMGRFYRLFLRVRSLPQPTLAAVNGAAIGAGCCVALACDLRIAAREAKLGLNFNRLGLHPGMAASWTLPRIVGSAHAAELLYTGRILDGAEAERIGLVNRAVPRETLRDDALALARSIAENAPLSVRATKRSLALSPLTTLEEQLDQEAREQALGYESSDLIEGLAAARERRAPAFEGR